ncbi:unnamed protein product [Clonostachys rosea]|uniref:Uncharacterized protein n=1 Tax=Bionectria ochroleuca TaxID=29856 RepID=A0ABY6U8Y0_BIOOC|nr:unnamed protein product [Clonostachys rosea]
MGHRQAQAKCGGAIASLEGRQNIQLPDDIISASTLHGLDKRLRRLEGNFSILSPPAGLDPTWDSLALRLYRVQKDNRAPTLLTPTSVRSLPNSFLDLVPDPSAVPIDTLQTLCAEIKLSPGFSRTSQHGRPWPKYANDDDALDVIRQRLCHAASQIAVCLSSIPYTRSEIYAALADLTVEPVMPRLPPRGPIPMPPPLHGGKKKKVCCGCCACDCHPRRVAADDASSVSSVSRGRGRGRGGLLGFLGKLAFWRRPKLVSDGASFSSG